MRKVATPEPEGFLDFWAVWQPHMRKTDGRGDAREAFRKHILNGADPHEIIDGAKAFIRSLNDEERRFIPLVASWLNKEAYPDWAIIERVYQARCAAQALQQQNVVPMRRSDPKPMSEEERQRREQFVNTVRRLEG